MPRGAPWDLPAALTIELHVLLLLLAAQGQLEQLSCADEQVAFPGQVAKARSWSHVSTQGFNGPALFV